MKISVLVLARRRSRFLAHYILNFLNHTTDMENTELLVMASEDDDWNKDLIEFCSQYKNIKFFFENDRLGRHGRHIFFNRLAEKAEGEWILHTCDDQMFVRKGWDNYVRDYVRDHSLDHNKVNILIPRFNNTGSVDHFVSRGYLNALGMVGGYGNIDSWINNVLEEIPSDRIKMMPDELMCDLTVYPEILTPEYLKMDDSEGRKLPAWDSEEVKEGIFQAQEKLKEAILNGA